MCMHINNDTNDLIPTPCPKLARSSGAYALYHIYYYKTARLFVRLPPNHLLPPSSSPDSNQMGAPGAPLVTRPQAWIQNTLRVCLCVEEWRLWHTTSRTCQIFKHLKMHCLIKFMRHTKCGRNCARFALSHTLVLACRVILFRLREFVL